MREIIIPEELLEQELEPEILKEFEGLSLEAIEAARRIMPYVKRGVKRWIETSPSLPVKPALEKDYVFYYHGKIPTGSIQTIEYFSVKVAGERYNFKIDGIQPETPLKLIGLTAFITPLKTTSIDINNIIMKMLKADISLFIKSDEKLTLPLEMLIDFNPVVAVSTTETAKTIELIYLRNSKLERGMLPLAGIILPAKETLSIKVNFKESFTNETYSLFFGISARKL
ncbi:MAG: hypothetical protein NC926_08310 [Candidatus Omnitrophica bacterium]|nr:hypothetical protein [Candidatus Omnitrophota bacterium]